MDPRGPLLGFLGNLDFEHPSHGLATFLRFGGALGLLKINKKIDLEKNTKKKLYKFKIKSYFF